MSSNDTLSLDQLRIFAAVVDAGSFTGAARVMARSQPAVSYAVASLEAQLGVALFERGRRRPTPTAAGMAVLAYARRLTMLGNELQAVAGGIGQGVEPRLVLAVDDFFPADVLGGALAAVAERYPAVLLDIRVGSRDDVLARVLDRSAMLGIGGVDAIWPHGIDAVDFGVFEIWPVAAPSHPLAAAPVISTSLMRDYVQITNKTTARDDRHDAAVNSTRIWQVDDAGLLLALLRAGVGWAYLPRHLAEPEMDAERIVRLRPETRIANVKPFSLIRRTEQTQGPALRFLADTLRTWPWHRSPDRDAMRP